MCGIIYVDFRQSNLKKSGKRMAVLERLYDAQKSRGSDGFGYVSIKDGEVIAFDRAESVDTIKRSLYQNMGDIVLFHHRFPTSTENVAELNHPLPIIHEMLDYNYFVVHNGVIHNPDAVKKEHAKLGINYSTLHEEISSECINIPFFNKKSVQKNSTVIKFNDSEALAWDLALMIEGKIPNIRTYGTNAFIVLQVEKKTNKVTKVFYGHNAGNPLCLSTTKEITSLRSVGGESIDTNLLFSFDINTGVSIATEHIFKRYDNDSGIVYSSKLSNDEWSSKTSEIEKAIKDGYTINYHCSPNTCGYKASNLPRKPEKCFKCGGFISVYEITINRDKNNLTTITKGFRDVSRTQLALPEGVKNIPIKKILGHEVEAYNENSQLYKIGGEWMSLEHVLELPNIPTHKKEERLAELTALFASKAALESEYDSLTDVYYQQDPEEIELKTAMSRIDEIDIELTKIVEDIVTLRNDLNDEIVEELMMG